MYEAKQTLEELGREYIDNSMEITKIINRKREELKALPNPETSRAAYRLKAQLNKLYAMRRELRDTGGYLINNYPDSLV